MTSINLIKVVSNDFITTLRNLKGLISKEIVGKSAIISKYDLDRTFEGKVIKVNDVSEIDTYISNFVIDRDIDSVYLIGGQELEDKYRGKNIIKKTIVINNDTATINETEYNKGELPYLDLISELVQKSTLRETRNAKTISTFGPQLEFDLRKGFPLLTTKKMFWKGIILELLFMLRGHTNSKLLEKDGVKIWEPNTTVDFIRSRGLPYEEGDMGPMYGYLWRHFGYSYEGCNASYKNKGYDQLLFVINELVNSPSSRRIVMTTFDPTQVPKSVLPPCHGLTTQFYVDEIAGERYLSCKMTQRSADIFLGLPFNIASYAALTHILCQITGYKPYKLIISLGDAHIYETHVEQCMTQASRLPYDFPKLIITKPYDGTDPIEYIEHLSYNDFVIEGYVSHSPIKADMIA